jgi:repressor LexA
LNLSELLMRRWIMARKSEPNERQLRILKFLASFQEKNGFPPTIREIGEHIDVQSTSQVTYYLNQLVKKELIERGGHTSRGIRILNKAYKYMPRLQDVITFQISGPIVASEPIPMPDANGPYYDPESTVDIAASLLHGTDPGELFALEVKGDSMIDAMINDGDIIIMRQSNTANNGDMVAVWLDDNNETTLKYFYKEKNRIRLQPANPTMGPIYIDNPEQVRIMGKVVLVIRQTSQMVN